MEITRNAAPDVLELRLQGRMDAYWADYVGNAIDEAIRAGSHLIQLNLAQVDYLSSAGLRTILKYYKQLRSVQGTLSVTHPSDGALEILKLAGLSDLLLVSAKPPAPVAVRPGARRVDRGRAIFQVFEQVPGAQLECTVTGQPEKFASDSFQEGDCANVVFPDGTLGLGLGAFGSSYADCRQRFGEFLAIAGCAAALPTDGSNVPDWLITEADLVPRLQVLYGLRARGRFAQMIRFDAKPEPPGVIGLGELVDVALEISGATTGGFAILAEAAGLVGAALRQSPAREGAAARLEFPGVRDWISFTTERTNTRSLALIVGVASHEPAPELAPFLRPIGPGTAARGHFHGAVFPYRPVQRGELNLQEMITGLLAVESAQTLLHLLADEREFEGIGQSDLLRGACWVGPIAQVHPSHS